MKKWIRTPGLAAFVGLTALIGAVWYFFVDTWAEWAVEETGAFFVGAKVDLAQADVTFLPLGVTLSKLEVTNPDEPMENAVEVREIAFGLDALNALRRKAIIEEMAVEGVQFSTPRKTSGALPQKAGESSTIKEFAKDTAEKLEIPSFEVPDVKKLLESEDLESLKIVNSVKEQIEAEKTGWKKRLDELPNKETFEKYKKRADEIKKGGKGGAAGALAVAGDIQKLKADIDKDLNAIKKAKSDLENKVSELQKLVKDAKDAPFKDIERLKDKYGLSPKGIANLTRIFLGPKIAHWTRQALIWHARLKPMLDKAKDKKGEVEVEKPARAKGVDVKFAEKEPLPDFLVRKAGVSVELEAGEFSGEITDITSDQPILGRPLKLAFAAEKLKGMDAITLNGSMNRVSPEKPKDNVRLELKGYKLASMSLSDSADWPIQLEGALTDAVLDGTLEGENLNATIKANLRSLKLSAPFKKDNAVAKAIASALEGVNSFALEAKVRGTLKQYDLELKSDLDKILQQAVDRLLGDLIAKFEKELKDQIFAKVGGPLKELDGLMGGFGGIGDELSNRLKAGSFPVGGGAANSLLPTGGKKSKIKLPF
ncbi:MAG: TIGR03545 family protein [Bdellovibrionota bacterium]